MGVKIDSPFATSIFEVLGQTGSQLLEIACQNFVTRSWVQSQPLLRIARRLLHCVICKTPAEIRPARLAVPDGFQRRFVLAIYVAASCRPAGVKPTETMAFARVAFWRMRLFSTRTTCRRRLCNRNRYQGAIAISKTL